MGDYIRKKRLNKACELLREGYNVSETAYKTGFVYPSYFTRCFKKEFGIKPTEYS
jgi:AraC-like DNA-binding protein